MSRFRSSRGFRVTARDREIVRWSGRLRMVTAAQVAERFALGRSVSYARLSGLVQLGLLEHSRIFHAAPGVYTATRMGLATADLALPPARVDVRTYDHDVELSSLVGALEREFGRDRLTTEREMRAWDSPLATAPPDPPRFAVPVTGGRGQLRLTPVGRPRLPFRTASWHAPRPMARSWLLSLSEPPKGDPVCGESWRRTWPRATSDTFATTRPAGGSRNSSGRK